MNKDKFMQFRVPTELKEQAQAIADERHESLSAVMRRCLEAYIENADTVEEPLTQR